MKSRNAVTTRRRHDIAKLLWELRSLKRSVNDRSAVIDRLAKLKREIGPAFRYVQIAFATAAARDVVTFRLDKDLLHRIEAQEFETAVA